MTQLVISCGILFVLQVVVESHLIVTEGKLDEILFTVKIRHPLFVIFFVLALMVYTKSAYLNIRLSVVHCALYLRKSRRLQDRRFFVFIYRFAI
jgi:hypothetical protein